MNLSSKYFEILRRLLNHRNDDFVELARIAGLRMDCDFRNADLRGVNFGSANTTGWDFSGSDLSNADLSHTHGTPPLLAGARTHNTKYPARVPKEVYISSVIEDTPSVDRLVQELKMYGIMVWSDRTDILPGVSRRSAISDAIKRCRFFLVCFSRAYNSRAQAYIEEELRLAIDELRSRPRNAIWIVPVLLDESKIPPLQISGAGTMADLQAVKLYGNWAEGMKQLLYVLLKDSAPKSRSDAPMEYVFVRFDAHDQRRVLANGNPVGLTGVGLTIEADFYVITLSGDHYSPRQWSGPISGTSPHNPLRIDFTRV